MKKIALTTVLVVMSAHAHAKTMSCVVGVYRAADMKETAEPMQGTKVVEVTIDEEGSGEIDEKINNEEVYISLQKYPHADVYSFGATLFTPESDRGNCPFVTGFTDHLVNAGPAKDNSWTVNPKPGAISYEYLGRPVGTFALTPKLKKALEANGLWGKHPFTSLVMDVQYSHYVAEAVKSLLKNGALKETDVLALVTAFSCTENK